MSVCCFHCHLLFKSPFALWYFFCVDSLQGDFPSTAVQFFDLVLSDGSKFTTEFRSGRKDTNVKVSKESKDLSYRQNSPTQIPTFWILSRWWLCEVVNLWASCFHAKISSLSSSQEDCREHSQNRQHNIQAKRQSKKQKTRAKIIIIINNKNKPCPREQTTKPYTKPLLVLAFLNIW